MRSIHRILILTVTLTALILTSCLPAEDTPGGNAPTPRPTVLQVIDLNSEITPTEGPTPTPAPDYVAPDIGGSSILCEGNTDHIRLLDGFGEPFAVISRIEALGDYLYLTADGGLYRLKADQLEPGDQQVETLLIRDDRVGDRPVQEIADIAVDPVGGWVAALDKAGHVYGYNAGTGELRLIYRANPDQDTDDGYDPQLTSVAFDDGGHLLMLDAALGKIRTPLSMAELIDKAESVSLTSGIDLAYVNGRNYYLRMNGSIYYTDAPEGSHSWQNAGDRAFGLSLKASGDELLVVDALRREIVGFDPADGDVESYHVYTSPTSGMIRDAVYLNDKLLLVEDETLIVSPGSGSGGACALPTFELGTLPLLYGKDMLALMSGMVAPIEGMDIPNWFRLIPGARRLYRLGVHHGTDIYNISAPRGFNIGWPVRAMGDGLITEVVDVSGMTSERFHELVDKAEGDGLTDAEAMRELLGIQVTIDHGNGVVTHYAHLDALQPGVRSGVVIAAGQVIGTVGVTGTLGEPEPGMVNAHLHFEIYVDGHYLGEGLTLAETRWWLEEFFE